MGRRESARFRRRRQAWWEVQSGASSRQAPDEETQREFVTAIDWKRSQAFGIERLARLQLDGGAPAPAWVSRTNNDGTLSLLRYASLRGRERIVGMLLRGGASLACWPCDGETVDMESLTLLPVQDASRCLVLAARFAEAATEGFAWRRLEEAQRKRWWVGCGCAVAGEGLFAHLAVRRPYGAFVPCPTCGAEVVPAPVTRARELDADVSGTADQARQNFAQLSDKIRTRITDALFAAARRGDVARLKRMLIGDGCDVDALDEQGGTAALAASLAGQAAFLDVLRTAGADLGRSSAVAPPHGDVAAVDAARLAPGPAPADLSVEERSLGVMYVRGCCSEAEVESLTRLHASLPVAKAAKLQCGLERRHFVDATRWLDALVRSLDPQTLGSLLYFMTGRKTVRASDFLDEEKDTITVLIWGPDRANIKDASRAGAGNVATVDGWLPTSSTCARQLQLPAYTSSAKLREQLLGALKQMEEGERQGRCEFGYE